MIVGVVKSTIRSLSSEYSPSNCDFIADISSLVLAFAPNNTCTVKLFGLVIPPSFKPVILTVALSDVSLAKVIVSTLAPPDEYKISRE